jgi:rfaE bifunctional protein nucleotidyltransferase chain/domain/rfaE bifunctional protein kinase chain/domain
MSRLVVIGDALLDRDVFGSVDRLCPDAPAPVVAEQDVADRPGGAALAALLAARAGGTVTLVTPLAEDAAAARIRELLCSEGVTFVDWRDPAPTVEKQRIMVRERPLIRLDRGGGRRRLPAPPDDVLGEIEAADALLASDYGRGALEVSEIRSTLDAAIAAGVPVVWDPHPKGAPPPAGVRLATPSTSELAHFDAGRAHRRGGHGDELAELVGAARRLLAMWHAAAVCVTRGSDGAALVPHGGLPLVVPVDQPETDPIDTCGAGDAFASACALALAAGCVTSEAVQSAVGEAASFVAAGGARGVTAPVRQRPTPLATASSTTGRLVATGGCFDLIHAGHVAMLQQARRLGDRLIVLLNSDASVRRLKGPGRPVNTAEDRSAVLRSLACVDDVLVFDDDTPIESLRRLRPEIFVKGGDYSSATLPESTVMSEWGGVVVTVPYLSGHSTSGIVEQIGAAHVV